MDISLDQIIAKLGAGDYAVQIKQAVAIVKSGLDATIEQAKVALTDEELATVEGLPLLRVQIDIAKASGEDVEFAEGEFDTAIEGLGIVARKIVKENLKQTVVTLAKEAGKWALKIAIGAALAAIGL